MDNSVFALLADGSAMSQNYLDFQKDFGADEVLVVELNSSHRRAFIDTLEQLANRLNQSPIVKQQLGPLESYPEFMTLFADPELGAELSLETIQRQNQSPLNQQLSLLTIQKDSFKARIYSIGPSGQPQHWQTLAQDLERLQKETAPKVEMIYAGSPLLNLALDAEGKRVEQFALPALLLVIIAVLLFFLRSLKLLLFALLPVGLAIGASEALLSLLGRSNNLVVNMQKPLLLVILLASNLHLLIAFIEGLRSGQDRIQAAHQAAQDKSRAIVWALATTAIGFGSLAFSPLPPVNSFGLITSLGLLLGVPLLTAAVPYALARWGPKSLTPRKLIEDTSWLPKQAPALIPASVLAIVLLGLGGWSLSELPQNPHAIRYFAADHPVRAQQQYFEQQGLGTASLEVILKASAITPESQQLKLLNDLAKVALQHPQALARMDAALLLREANYRASQQDLLPTSDQLAQWQPQLKEQLRNYWRPDQKEMRLSILLGQASHQDLEAIQSSLQNQMEDFSGHENYQLSFNGNYRLLLAAQADLLQTLLKSLLLTLLLMQIALVLALRSLKLSLLALAPNLIPVACLFGLMWGLNIPLDIGTCMTAAVALGIAVDDTLHFTLNYQKGGLPYAYNNTGLAMILSSVVIAAGFLALTPASFLPSRNFGLLAATALLAALLADLYLLPALLSAFDRPSRQ